MVSAALGICQGSRVVTLSVTKCHVLSSPAAPAVEVNEDVT